MHMLNMALSWGLSKTTHPTKKEETMILLCVYMSERMGRNYCLWAHCFFDEIPETKFLTDRVSRTDSKPITQCMRALRRAGSKACWQGSIVCLCYPFCLSAFPFLFCFVSLLVVVFCCFSCLSVF